VCLPCIKINKINNSRNKKGKHMTLLYKAFGEVGNNTLNSVNSPINNG
jgi:hypothetical protein